MDDEAPSQNTSAVFQPDGVTYLFEQLWRAFWVRVWSGHDIPDEIQSNFLVYYLQSKRAVIFKKPVD